MVRRGGSVDPSKFKDERFELHSIPAFDSGRPEFLLGSQIGSSKQIVQPDDVMISKIVPHIRRSSVVGHSSGSRQIASGEWIVFRSERIYPHYLRHVLISDQFNSQFMATVSGVGGSLLRARPAEVAKIKVPLPPIPEQRRIAAILDKADALRAKRREAIAKLDQLLQSVFLEMFGDPVENPKGWLKLPLEELCERSEDIKCGPFGTQLAKSEFTTEGVPLWGIKNVNAMFKRPTEEFVSTDTAERLIAYSIQPGDIVMTRKGTVGNCAIYPQGFPLGIMHSDLLRLRVSEKLCIPAFVSHQLHESKDVAHQLSLISGGAIMPGINVGKLKKLKVFVPPLADQRKFATAVENIERQKRDLQAHSIKLDDLFYSLQQFAFAGEL